MQQNKSNSSFLKHKPQYRCKIRSNNTYIIYMKWCACLALFNRAHAWNATDKSNARNKHTRSHKHIMVLTPCSPCLRKRRPAPTWYPCLQALVCHLPCRKSLTARAAHRRSRRWTCNRRSRMSTVSTCTSRSHIQMLQQDSTGPLTAHTPGGLGYTGTCGEEGGNSQAYTGRHRSPLVCVSVRERKCQCVRVLTSRNNHVNRTHTPQRSWIFKCKEYVFNVEDMHFIWKSLNACLCCKWSNRTPLYPS